MVAAASNPARARVVRNAAAIGVAVGAYGLSFGAAAVTAGLSTLQACVLSLVAFTGASQFALVGVLGAGGSAAAGVAGSLLLGLPFTAITFFAMQEVRRVRPAQATSFMGLLTAMYGVGQIAGPPMAAWLVGRSANAGAGFALSLWIASALLAAGAVLYVAIARAYPHRDPR